MLVAVIVLFAIQLAVAGVCVEMARRGRKGSLVLVALAAFFGFCVFLSPLVMLQFLALLLVGGYCLKWQPRPGVFLALGTTASVVLILFSGLANQRRMAALKERYPMQSLADRLAYETRHATLANHDGPGTSGADLHPAIEQPREIVPEHSMQLDELERAMDGRRDSWRIRALRQVHDSQVSHFISSEGFGVGRGIRPLNRLEYEYAHEIPPVAIRAPASPRSDVASAADEAATKPAVAPQEFRLTDLHKNALLDFAQPDHFGYVQDREHVAGFEPHGFTQLPMLDQPSQWHIQRVELVSLLKHERPMVYQSEFLPKMDELKSAPVRPLDAFEQRGLGKLRSGENLVVEAGDRQILMLGAIRAATQCLQCHSVERGALLGAFSYELLPDGQPAKATPVDKPAL